MQTPHFDFQYELVFDKIFDLNVIVNSNVPNKDNTDFQSAVENNVNSMTIVLSLQPGINDFSTYLDFNNVKYKITLNK